MARISFVELPSHDSGRDAGFYSAAFGLAFTGFGPSYASTMTGVVDLGLQADPADRTAAPLVVIAVDDLVAAQAAVEAAGAAIVVAAFDFPGGRRFHFVDPSGNELAVMQVVADA